jgi:hypothetical protein
MNKITFCLVIATACYSDQHFVLPNMIPSIIIEIVSSHVYQSMSETGKSKCAVIKDYLETQTRYFLIANPKFSKAIENFATSATDRNCQEILNQLINIFYGTSRNNVLHYPIDYNYIKSMLFSQQNSPHDKAYFNSLIAGIKIKFTNYISKQTNQLIYCNLKYHNPYSDKSQNNMLSMNLTDLVSQKIKDALTPSSKDDLKKIETIYKYIIKKLINFKNLVK